MQTIKYFLVILMLTMVIACGGSSGTNNSDGSGDIAGQALLTWTVPTANTDNTTLNDLAGYKILWGTTSGIYDNDITILNPGLATYTVNSLVEGEYFFALQALDNSGNLSAYSNELTKTVQ